MGPPPYSYHCLRWDFSRLPTAGTFRNLYVGSIRNLRHQLKENRLCPSGQCCKTLKSWLVGKAVWGLRQMSYFLALWLCRSNSSLELVLNSLCHVHPRYYIISRGEKSLLDTYTCRTAISPKLGSQSIGKHDKTFFSSSSAVSSKTPDQLYHLAFMGRVIAIGSLPWEALDNMPPVPREWKSGLTRSCRSSEYEYPRLLWGHKLSLLPGPSSISKMWRVSHRVCTRAPTRGSTY
jgi:hypothetical protein